MHNDALIFFILAGIALIFKWLTRQASNDSEKPEPPDSIDVPNKPVTRAPAQSDEERVRRFLKALGQPSGSQPPPRVKPRTAVERRTFSPARPVPPARIPGPKVKRGWAQPLPPLTTMPPEPLVIEATPEPIVAAAPPPGIPVAPVVRLARRAAVPRSVVATSLSEMLRVPRSVRQAIMLREILGPPRGLEPLG
jgi:hypothetical protein